MVNKRSVVRTAHTELTSDDIKDIEAEIERGRSSASIALDYEISSPEVSAIRRNFNRRTAPRNPSNVPTVQPNVFGSSQEPSQDEKLLSQLQALQSSARLRSQIDFEIERQKADQEYLEEKRSLELERLQLENERLRSDINPPSFDAGEIAEQAKENPEGLLANFAMKLFELWQKQPPVSALQPSSATISTNSDAPVTDTSSSPVEVGRASQVTPDWSQEQPIAILEAMQAQVPPEQVAIAKMMSKKAFGAFLKSQVPTISETNINNAYQLLHRP